MRPHDPPPPDAIAVYAVPPRSGNGIVARYPAEFATRQSDGPVALEWQPVPDALAMTNRNKAMAKNEGLRSLVFRWTGRRWPLFRKIGRL